MTTSNTNIANFQVWIKKGQNTHISLQTPNTNIALYLGLAKEGLKHTDAVNIHVSQQADYKGKKDMADESGIYTSRTEFLALIGTVFYSYGLSKLKKLVIVGTV